MVQRKSTHVSQPQFLPDNAYGNFPPTQISRDINLGLDPIQEESLPQEESSMDVISAEIVQRPTNELEDLGEMYSSKWMQHYFTLTIDQGEWNIPKQYWDIAKLPREQQKSWYDVTKDEMKSLHDRKVWDLVDLPKDWKPVKGRWVFAIWSDNHVKAHFIAKGFTQIFGIDYEETFSPVARFETVCLILALAALHDWEIKALDVKTAFLFGELDKEIYMVQPEGFIVKDQESKVCCLQKAIYGLKQAALQWNKLLHKSLVDFGFKRCTSDSGVYVKFIGKDIILIVIYIDDALFLGSNKLQVLSHKKKFMQKWKSGELGKAKEYLDMRITRDRWKRSLILDQTKYTSKVVKCFSQENCKETSVPLPTGYIPRPNERKENFSLHSHYQSVIGSLLYIMLGTRPDIPYAMTKILQYSFNPSEEYLQKAIQIVCYLSHSQSLCIKYSPCSPVYNTLFHFLLILTTLFYNVLPFSST